MSVHMSVHILDRHTESVNICRGWGPQSRPKLAPSLSHTRALHRCGWKSHTKCYRKIAKYAQQHSGTEATTPQRSTARSSADLMKTNEMLSQKTHVGNKIMQHTVNPELQQVSHNTHGACIQGCARMHPVLSRPATQYLHSQTVTSSRGCDCSVSGEGGECRRGGAGGTGAGALEHLLHPRVCLAWSMVWFRWGCTASCGWNVRCVGVRRDAWPVMLSPCNTLGCASWHTLGHTLSSGRRT